MFNHVLSISSNLLFAWRPNRVCSSERPRLVLSCTWQPWLQSELQSIQRWATSCQERKRASRRDIREGKQSRVSLKVVFISSMYRQIKRKLMKYVFSTKKEWDVVHFTPCPVEWAPQHQLLMEKVIGTYCYIFFFSKYLVPFWCSWSCSKLSSSTGDESIDQYPTSSNYLE